MGADHYRRAQHDARISAGAFANNLILPGLICCWSAGLSENHRKCDPEVKHRHGRAVGRRNVRQTPDVRLQPHILGESAIRRYIIVYGGVGEE